MRIRQYVLTVAMFALGGIACGQSLDWTGDVIVFGTAGNEAFPSVTFRTGSNWIRALCVMGNDTLCSKVSGDRGNTWSTSGRMRTPVAEPRMELASDRSFQYVFLSGSGSASKTVFRFTQSGNDWQTAQSCNVAPECTGYVLSAAAITDAAAGLDSTALNCTWMERAPQTNHYSVWFAQSRDQGQSFHPAHELISFDSPDAMAGEMSMAVAWSGSTERLIVAAPIDRAGTVPEGVRVFTSEDRGTTWGNSTAIDDAAFAQREVSVAAWGEMVVLVYSRRINAAAQRDIFFSYSPNGGLDFSPPMAITDSSADEHAPHIAVDAVGETFGVFYLADDGMTEGASVFLREGRMATPWDLAEPVQISDAGGAVREGGLGVTGGQAGLAAMWTSRFPLGDTDVKFDASWRGVSVDERRVEFPAQIGLGQNYPNPFNGRTVLPLTLERTQRVSIIVTDVLGRECARRQLGMMAPGTHFVQLDLSRLPSGIYWLRLERAKTAPVKMLLLK